MATLLLNADGQPNDIITWKQAVKLYLDNLAYVIKEGDRIIRSQFLTVIVPEVMMLKNYKKEKSKRLRVSRSLILYRDNFTCQYCGRFFATPSFLTMDHVLPKSRGGKSIIANLVTCCKDCNHKKGNKTPKESGLRLTNPVKDIRSYSLARYKIKILYPEWKEYL